MYLSSVYLQVDTYVNTKNLRTFGCTTQISSSGIRKTKKEKKRFEKNVHSMSVVLFEFFSIYRWSRWCVCIHSVQWLKKIKHEMELSAASATSFEKRLCAHRM